MYKVEEKKELFARRQAALLIAERRGWGRAQDRENGERSALWGDKKARANERIPALCLA